MARFRIIRHCPAQCIFIDLRIQTDDLSVGSVEPIIRIVEKCEKMKDSLILLIYKEYRFNVDDNITTVVTILVFFHLRLLSYSQLDEMCH